MRLRALNVLMVVLAAVVAVVFLFTAQETNDAYGRFERSSANYILCEQAASQMKAGSNYLTSQVRKFVVTQDINNLNNYFWEADDNRSRQHAVESLESLQGGESGYLQQSLADSMELMDLEFYAMKLVVEARGYHDEPRAAGLAGVELSADDQALSPDEKVQRAIALIFSDDYLAYVDRIEGNVMACKADLIEQIDAVQAESEETLHRLLVRQRILAVALFVVFVAMMVSVVLLVLLPLRTFNECIKRNDPLPRRGAAELRRLADSYNNLYEETMKSQNVLRRKAEHDHLTGLYNRSVLERVLNLHTDDCYALMLVDIDCFKDVNDTYGHDVGDAILQKVGGLLGRAFRVTDFPCRLGGDEFAVVMVDMDASLRHVVAAKAQTVQQGMLDADDGLPTVTLSIGVAFNDGTVDGEQMYKNADQALYQVKAAGRNGFAVYAG